MKNFSDKSYRKN